MKINLKNIIKLILIYEVFFILVNLLFDPFSTQFGGYNFQIMLSWAIGVPVAIILIYIILKR